MFNATGVESGQRWKEPRLEVWKEDLTVHSEVQCVGGAQTKVLEKSYKGF